MKNNRFKRIFLTCLMAVLGFTMLLAQNTITVTGTVTDEDNIPLIGVSVSNQSGVIGAVTNFDGQFTLTIPEGEMLIFTYIGYNPVNRPAIPVMNVQMGVNAVALDAVTIVGVGYGTMRKSDLTGAITSVSGDDLKKGIVTSAEQLLQGRVAGLTVVQASGDPTQGASLRLRGGTSLKASSNPLIVVDGIPGVDINTIQPGEIISIDVLKDASAAAIYGSRGANGVIIVTTNREGGGRQMSYHGYVAVSNMSNQMDLLSADQWRDYVRENNIGGAVDYGGNTDWQDELTRTGFSHNHNLSFTSGGEHSGLRASVNYMNIEGVVKRSSIQRLAGSVTAYQYGLNKRLKLETSIHANHDNYHPVNMDIWERAYNLNPTLPVTYNGEYTQIGGTNNNNPVELLNNYEDDQTRTRLLGYAKAELEIIEGLKATVAGSYEYNSKQERYYLPSNAYNGTTDKGYAYRTLGDYTNLQLETFLNYDKTFDEVHRLSLMAGYSYLDNMYEGFGAYRRGFDTNLFTYNNLGAGTDFRMGDVYSYKGAADLISFFGRVNYTYNDRYMFTGTLRRDGSSRFGVNRKWGYFPSASAAWRISEEEFMEGIRNWLDNLKLRVGYGVTGNQDGFGEYKSLKLIGTSGATYYDQATDSWKQAYGIIQNENPDIKWESTEQFNFGLDMMFLQRFNITIDGYIKKTHDLIYTYSVPQPPYQFPTMMANVGDLSNKGIEFTFGANIIKTKDINWNASLTLAHNKMTVDKLSNDTYQTDAVPQGSLHGLTGLSGVWTQTLREGYPVGTFWGPKFVEIDENGKFVFETDAEGNVIDQDLGSAQPKLSLGFTTDFVYKDFDLSIALYGMFGQKILNAQKMNLSYPGRMPAYNILDSYRDAVETEGPVFSDYWIEKGDFLRLQSVVLGYTLPVKNAWFSKIRFYIAGENLFVITGYSGLDPEVNISGLTAPGIDKSIYTSDQNERYYYPKSRSFSFGVNLTF